MPSICRRDFIQPSMTGISLPKILLQLPSNLCRKGSYRPDPGKKNLRLFRNFISLCAARGTIVNPKFSGNECGISQPTAKSWISVLETSYIVYQLQPYLPNFNKRITKSPKLFFYDTGLLCYLLKSTMQIHQTESSQRQFVSKITS